MRATFNAFEQTHGVRLFAKYNRDRLILSPSSSEKKPNFAVFRTSAFGDVANWQQSEKIEHGCATASLSLSNGNKIVFVLQRLHGEIGAQSLTFKSVTNKQTDKNSTFLAARRRVKSEPHQTWHGDSGPRARSCTSKTFGGLTHSFASRGR